MESRTFPQHSDIRTHGNVFCTLAFPSLFRMPKSKMNRTSEGVLGLSPRQDSEEHA